ncbi:DUF3253 domain-containing protein [Nocardioides panacisoli]|uniref:DUF3253 domain-containing protein n=1 Tax=Nocardioides panacisoli TaxID=627624 RepID=A0ABP7I6A1_9ACTN
MSDRPELSSQDPVVAALADRIVALLEERGPDRTICPSEAARAVWADTRDDTVEQGGEGWRALMEPAREASSLLRERGCWS